MNLSFIAGSMTNRDKSNPVTNRFNLDKSITVSRQIETIDSNIAFKNENASKKLMNKD